MKKRLSSTMTKVLMNTNTQMHQQKKKKMKTIMTTKTSKKMKTIVDSKQWQKI